VYNTHSEAEQKGIDQNAVNNKALVLQAPHDTRPFCLRVVERENCRRVDTNEQLVINNKPVINNNKNSKIKDLVVLSLT